MGKWKRDLAPPVSDPLQVGPRMWTWVTEPASLKCANQALPAGPSRRTPVAEAASMIATGRLETDVRRVLKHAGRMGWADEVAHDHFFLRSTLREMVGIAVDLAAEDKTVGFSAAKFRDRMDNGRKVAIQILEFFDRRGVTLRKGDRRRINTARLDLFGFGPETCDDARGGESSPVGRPDFKSVWGSEPASGGFDSHSLPPGSKRAG